MKNSGIIIGVLIAVIVVAGIIWFMKSQAVKPTVTVTAKPGASTNGVSSNPLPGVGVGQ